jgi:hypothetical protein
MPFPRIPGDYLYRPTPSDPWMTVTVHGAGEWEGPLVDGEPPPDGGGGEAGEHDHDDAYAPLAHTHDERYYTETEIDAALAGKASTAHTHDGGGEGGVSDHGALTGLADDDHTHYLTQARGDARYYTETELDAMLDAIDTALAGKANVGHAHDGGGGGGGVTDHGALTGLADDDHTQYLTQARGDARYYTEAEVNALLAAKEASLGNPSTVGAVLTGTPTGGRNWAILATGDLALVIAATDAPTVIKNRVASDHLCDGTDDHVQLQNAIDKATAYGVEAKPSTGRFVIRQPINMNKAGGGIKLHGSGDSNEYTRGGTTIMPHSSGFPTGRALIESGTTVYGPNNSIRDLTLDGRGYTYAVIHGLHTASYSGRIRDVTINGCSGWGAHCGSSSYDATDTRFNEVTIKSCGLGGIGALAGGSHATDMHMTGLLIFHLWNGAIAGIHLGTGTAGAHIHGGQIYDNPCPGILVQSVTHIINAMKIENNNHGIHFQGGGGTTVSACGFRGNSYSAENTYSNIYVQSGGDISITGGRNISNVQLSSGPFHVVKYGAHFAAGTSYIGYVDAIWTTYGTGTWGTAKVLNQGSNNVITGIRYP